MDHHDIERGMNDTGLFVEGRAEKLDLEAVEVRLRDIREQAQRAIDVIGSYTQRIDGADSLRAQFGESLRIQLDNIEKALQKIREGTPGVLYAAGTFEFVSDAATLAEEIRYFELLSKFVIDNEGCDTDTFIHIIIPRLESAIIETTEIDILQRMPLSVEVFSQKDIEARGGGAIDRACALATAEDGADGENRISQSYCGEMSARTVDTIVSDSIYIFDFDSVEELQRHVQQLDAMTDLVEEKTQKGEIAPVVIIHTPFSVPLRILDRYAGFLFTQSETEIASALLTAKNFNYTKTHKPQFMESTALAYQQERLYRDLDLRDIERKTADTVQSLRTFLAAIEKTEIHDRSSTREPLTIIDAGIGEGRMASLYAMLGKHVFGIDITPEQLQKVSPRVLAEKEKFQANDPRMPLVQFVDEGVVHPAEIVTDESVLTDSVVAVCGSFLHLADEVFLRLKEHMSTHPNFDPEKFFGDRRMTNPHFLDMSSRWDLYSDTGFDVIAFNWHTFCEAGTIDNQKHVLHDAFEILPRGGLLYIEIPDRSIGAYGSTLTHYHESHPQEPFGTVRDTTSEEVGVASIVGGEGDTPRFFPGKDQLISLLAQVGFEDVHVSSYLVISEHGTGKSALEAKELVITAHKPKQ